jgi:hypothetical protein
MPPPNIDVYLNGLMLSRNEFDLRDDRLVFFSPTTLNPGDLVIIRWSDQRRLELRVQVESDSVLLTDFDAWEKAPVTQRSVAPEPIVPKSRYERLLDED